MSWHHRFVPDLTFIHLFDINISDLKFMGYKAVLIDIDGTITHLNGPNISSKNTAWIANAADNLPLKIVTCNHNRKFLEGIGEQTNTKPLQRKIFESPSNFFLRCIKSLNLEPNEVAVINDSLIMLGLFVHPLGCFTIKVDSINISTTHSPIGYIYHLGQWLEKKFINPHL